MRVKASKKKHCPHCRQTSVHVGDLCGFCDEDATVVNIVPGCKVAFTGKYNRRLEGVVSRVRTKTFRGRKAMMRERLGHSSTIMVAEIYIDDAKWTVPFEACTYLGKGRMEEAIATSTTWERKKSNNREARNQRRHEEAEARGLYDLNLRDKVEVEFRDGKHVCYYMGFTSTGNIRVDTGFRVVSTAPQFVTVVKEKTDA